MADNRPGGWWDWHWFWLGLLAGLTVSVIRNPKGCGCMSLIAVLLLGLVVWALWPWSLFVAGGIGLLYYVGKWMRQQGRQ